MRNWLHNLQLNLKESASIDFLKKSQYYKDEGYPNKINPIGETTDDRKKYKTVQTGKAC